MSSLSMSTLYDHVWRTRNSSHGLSNIEWTFCKFACLLIAANILFSVGNCFLNQNSCTCLRISLRSKSSNLSLNVDQILDLFGKRTVFLLLYSEIVNWIVISPKPNSFKIIITTYFTFNVSCFNILDLYKLTNISFWQLPTNWKMRTKKNITKNT